MKSIARVVRVVVPVVLLLVPTTAAIALTAPAPVARMTPELASKLGTEVGDIGIIAQFRTPPTEADGRSMLTMGFKPGMTRYTIVPAVYAQGPASAVRKLAANPRVTFIEHDRILPYTMDRSTAVTRSKQIWDATYDLAGTVHTDGITGRDIGIAIFDSGVDARHQDLLWKPLADATDQPAKTVVNVRIAGTSGVANLAPEDLGVNPPPFTKIAVGVDVPNSDNTGGHGTHVAGIAAGLGLNSHGKYTGTAPGANIIGIGAGDTLAIHSSLVGFQWLHENKDRYNIRVVNNSWGGAGEYSPDLALSKAISRISNEDGIVVVFAAGNSGGDGSDVQSNVWGNIPEVIQVANYYDKSGWLDDTSSRGQRDKEETWPDVAAPGSQIISTAALGGPVTYFGSGQDAVISEIFGYDEPIVVPAQTPEPIETTVDGREVIVGDYASFSGTSMAAPAVAGVAALILEANPALTPAQVRLLMRETANLLPGRTYANDGFAMGKGVVDAAEAVAVALEMREGKTMAQALASASLDLTSSPVTINTGAGPVTDNTVPLLPAPGPTVTGNPQMFHGDLVDPAVLTGTYGFVPGEPVGLLLRALTSNDSTAAPLTPGNFTGTMRILRDGVPVYGPFAATVGSDSFGTALSGDWTVPVDAPVGNYVFETLVTILSTSTTYSAGSLDFFIGAPA